MKTMIMTGADLVQWREHHGLSQNTVADFFGVSRQTIISWEKAGSVARLVQIAMLAADAGIVDLQSYKPANKPGRPPRQARSHVMEDQTYRRTPEAKPPPGGNGD